LLQEVSGLIDVANVQDDLLQRLKEETRISSDRRDVVLKEVDCEIMELSEVSSRHQLFPRV
jgi:nuclear pore complex protein Nup155